MVSLKDKGADTIRTSTILLLSACAAFADFFQTPGLSDAPSGPSAGIVPLFSDIDNYNAYDFCGSPLGLLETENTRVSAVLGFRSITLTQASPDDSLKRTFTSWSVPDLLIGKPNLVYLKLFYAPASLDDNTRWNQHLSLPLQRFGLTVAGQVPSGIFQIALRGRGALGNEELKGSENSRLIMALEDLNLTIGSRLHELVTVGMQGGVRAKFDSLKNYSTSSLRDRYFTGQIPLLGWYVDFGKEGFPVASDFSLQIATSRFVYVTGFNVDQDPVKGDSLAWKWQTIGDFRSGGFGYRPALFLGYWRNHYQAFEPTEENDDLNVGPKRPGRDWKWSNFCYGLGATVSVSRYVSGWIEYSHSAMALEYGNAWPDSAAKRKGYDRFTVGVEIPLHAALRFPSSIETSLRFGYFTISGNSGIDAFQSEEFGLLNEAAGFTQEHLYRPDFGWGSTERVRGFLLGLSGSFIEKTIEAGTYVAFLSKSGERKSDGLEFGVTCAYNLKEAASSK